MNAYIFELLVAVDRLLNAVTNGSSDETLSSRAYRVEQKGRIVGRVMRPVIDTIFFWQHKHCETSYLYERDKARLEAMPK